MLGRYILRVANAVVEPDSGNAKRRQRQRVDAAQTA
jgi:hypothetical protein